MSLLESPYVDGRLLPVFVYGTLQPGEVRWFALDGHVDALAQDSVRGTLWDTGFGYPALTRDDSGPEVPGHLLHLSAETSVETWQRLVEIEGGVQGYYVPDVIRTIAGAEALVFVYDNVPDEHFTRIARWRGGPEA